MSDKPAPTSWSLKRFLEHAHETIEILQATHGVVFDTDESILNALEEEGLEPKALLARFVRASIEAGTYAAGAKLQAKLIMDRQARFETQEDRYRQLAYQLMDMLGMRKHVEGDFTATITAGRASVVVPDVDALDGAYVKVSKVPMRAAIATAIRNGMKVEGATMSNAPDALQIKAR